MELKLVTDTKVGSSKWDRRISKDQAHLTTRQWLDAFDAYELNPYISIQANLEAELEDYRRIIKEMRETQKGR